MSTSEAVDDSSVDLKNTGFTAVYDFAEMDFFVEYIDASDVEHVKRLTDNTGGLAYNEWEWT